MRRSPFLSFWRHPIWTVRDLVDDDPKRFTLLFASLWCFAFLGERSIAVNDIRDIGSAFVVFVTLPLLGILLFFMRRFVVAHVGRWLGGTAEAPAVGVAVAWAWLPVIVVAVVRLFAVAAMIVLAGRPGPILAALATAIDTVPRGLAALATFIAVMWSAVLEVHLIATVHGINKRRSFLASTSTVVVFCAAFAGIGAVLNVVT